MAPAQICPMWPRPRPSDFMKETCMAADNPKDVSRADFSNVTGGSSSAAPTEGKRPVTVQPGDSLSRIAKRELGDAERWHAIYAANRETIKNPDLIHPGQVLN